MCTCVCSLGVRGGEEQRSYVFHLSFPPYLLSQGLLLNWELTDWLDWLDVCVSSATVARSARSDMPGFHISAAGSQAFYLELY